MTLNKILRLFFWGRKGGWKSSIIKQHDSRDAENILTVLNRVMNGWSQKFSKLSPFFGITARTKSLPATTEGKQVFMTTSNRTAGFLLNTIDSALESQLTVCCALQKVFVNCYSSPGFPKIFTILVILHLGHRVDCGKDQQSFLHL